MAAAAGCSRCFSFAALYGPRALVAVARILTGLRQPRLPASPRPVRNLHRHIRVRRHESIRPHRQRRRLAVTARAIAHAYSVFATGGAELKLRRETLDLLAAPAVRPVYGFFDECMKGEVEFSLGFMKPNAAWPFGSPAAFGAPGAGGSIGFADPATAVGYAYVTSQSGTSVTGDPREVALRDALREAVAALPVRPQMAA